MIMNLKKSYMPDPVEDIEPPVLDGMNGLESPSPPSSPARSSTPPLASPSTPLWHKAFYLGDNVRFTRTPDIEFIRKRAQTDETAAAKLRSLTQKQRREHHPIQNPHAAPTGDTMPQANASLVQDDNFSCPQNVPIEKFPKNTERFLDKNCGENKELEHRSDSRFAQFSLVSHPASLISDFAYFDCGVDLLQNAPMPDKNQVNTQQDDMALEGTHKSIADLFHVLECRFAKNEETKGAEGDTTGDGVPDMSPPPPFHGGVASFTQHYHVVPTVTTVRFDVSMAIQRALLQQERDETSPPQTKAQTGESTEILEEEELAQPIVPIEVEQLTDCPGEVENAQAQSGEPEEPISSHKNVAITLRPARPLPSNDLGKGLRPAELVDDYAFPSLDLLQPPIYQDGTIISQETLERSAGLLENVLEDFGIRGEIIHVRPGPVVTLYEFEPAPGVKSSRIIGLADDIARSMSAISARVAVIPGRNVIGIELPNPLRETVFLRELIQADAYLASDFKLPLALGKNIGGEPIVAELAKMPHLLVAGTTGSGKSVAINTMILSLLYRLTPDQCRLIMVDPKMLELSIYDGIPHLLTPVVTDPKKAVTALKWAVREMEERYRKMAKLGVRNIDGFNARIIQASQAGETITCTVQAGFDKETGELLYEEEAMDLTPLPYIVVIVDEMADLMMVAGKEIEGAIQRLAQMARAAGIHLIMATQRPSVDVITGTIKANFPTRISFQVTSKIDSRTILGEPGAETLLGQGDMLHMAGGGRIVRVHGAFVSDSEVESIVSHLKAQGKPDYLATVTTDNEEMQEEEASNIAEIVANIGEDSEELYVQAVKVVMRDKKCSTSYIQRRLGIGYNKAASLVERMEQEGLVGAANHVGKREILSPNRTKSEGEA